MASFPGEDFEKVQIGLQHTIFSSKSRGGMVSEVRVADPYWYGELVTVGLEREEIAEWEAFLAESIDRQLSVDFVHPLYPCPISYNVDTFPGAATGTLDAIVDGRTIHIDLLDPGLVLKKGDRISIEQGDRVCYYMIAADVTVATSATDVFITPRLRTGLFTVGAVVRVKGAKMRLRVETNSVGLVLVGGEPTAISFNVYEDGR